jgi:hypothetical protein
MRDPARFAWLLAAMSAIAGCRGADLASLAARPDAVDARQITDSLARGDVAAVTARFDASLGTPDPEMGLKLMAELPLGDPLDVRLVNYKVSVTKVIGASTSQMTEVTFESRYQRGYVVTTVLLRRVAEGERRILGMHVQAFQPVGDARWTLRSMDSLGLVSRGGHRVHDERQPGGAAKDQGCWHHFMT